MTTTSNAELKDLTFRWWDDRWIPYDPDTQEIIRTIIESCNATSSSLSSVPPFTIVLSRGKSYTLDLTRMRQINESTGFERKIDIIVGSSYTNSNEYVEEDEQEDEEDEDDEDEDEDDEEEEQEQQQQHSQPMEDVGSSDVTENTLMTVDYATLNASDHCILCLEEFKNTDKIVIPIHCTGHFFHAQCPTLSTTVLQYMQTHKKCPGCRKHYGILYGNMPRGTMKVVRMDHLSLPGYESYKTLKLLFDFPSGIQDDSHPNPGTRYEADHRVAYLPDSDEGRHVERLIQKAWDRRLLFTIGTSVTRGVDGCIVYNGIHFKTVPVATPGEPWGWPDKTYLHRVTQELSDKGIY